MSIRQQIEYLEWQIDRAIRENRPSRVVPLLRKLDKLRRQLPPPSSP